MFSPAPVDPGRVAVYIRWSTEEQGSGTTLAVQRDACRHFIQSQGWQFREDLIFVDDGYSGASLLRPALTSLRAAVTEGRVAAVVVYKLDRLSRNLMDCVNLVRREWSSVALFSTMERFDTHSSIGQMVFNILVSFAEFERNVIRERTLSGKRKRREQGRNPGMAYPFGYRKAEGGGFEIEPAAAEVVRRIFAQYLAGMGHTAICDQLNRQAIPSPRGLTWRKATVKLILQNPIYAGHLPGGYYTYEQGKQKRGKAPTFLLRGAVPTIIAQEEFDRAQALAQNRSTTRPTPDRSSDYLLTTILRCARCGGAMCGQNGSDGRRYYRCINQKELKTCDSGIIPKALVERQVLEAVRRSVAPEHLRSHLQRLDALRRRQAAEGRGRVQRLAERLAGLEKQRAKLDADYLSGAVDAKQYGRLTSRLETEAGALSEQLANARVALDVAEQPREAPDPAAFGLDDLAAHAPLAARSVLRQLIAEISVRRERSLPDATIEILIKQNVAQ